MRPLLHARLHARLQNRLQKREPGLLGLPVPLPSVPLLSPVVTPLVGSNPPQPAQPALQPAPQPASQPAPQPGVQPVPAPQPAAQPNSPSGPPPGPPPQQAPDPSNPPASNPPSGGNGNGRGGGPPPNAGGSSGNPAEGQGPPPGKGDPGSDSSPSGSGSGSGSNPGSPPQAQPSPGSLPGAEPSLSSSGTSPGSPNGSLSLGSGTSAGLASTGVVALPLNNDAAVPTSSSGSTPSDVVQGAVGGSSGITKGSASTTTHGASLPPPASSQGSSDGLSNGNGSSGNGSTSANYPSSASHSQLSSRVIGIIIAIAIILCALLAFYILRKRHLRRKAERQVQWINGCVTEDTPDMQGIQRCTSMRSSWGTPVEHRFSDPFQMSVENSAHNTPEGVYNAESPYPYNLGNTAPVLPMPVHSPFENRLSPENPFADNNSSPQPIKRMSSLPIRISLISDGSGSPDPFDDAHGYVIDDQISESGVPSTSFGHGSSVDRDAAHGTQANFPMPPPTSSSTSTVFAIGSLSQLLEPPGIRISYPDSPVSPTFAATGTSSYPRRASVKLPFHPSQDRQDEVLLESGHQVNVVSVYEDGWAFVQNEKTNERGLVPLDRLEMDNP